MLLLLAGAALWLLSPDNKARRAVEQTRRALHQQGFKVEISEFDLSSPAGLGTNNETLMLAADASRNLFSIRRLDLMRPVTSNSALVTWNEENPSADMPEESFWPDLRENLAERSGFLDRACEAVLSAPFRFKTILVTNDALIPDVFRARLLGSAIAARTVLALHDRRHGAAWTNLLALTRLVTVWQTEPMDISHFMRFRWLGLAQRVTWEALQAKDWTGAELEQLQAEWESPDFFAGLPETAAFARASTIAFCAYQRRQPPPRGPTLREFVSDLINSPGRARDIAKTSWRDARYRNYESYEDENAWLLYLRDCELDYRKALTAHSWAEIRTLPSATNSRPPGASSSVLDALRNAGPGNYGAYQRQGLPLLARAAEAEARRRLIVTAIALERYYFANHSYPDSLSKLTPEFLKSTPKDFIDGEPLRYRRTDDGRFLLYSVGLDGVDDFGNLLADVKPSSFPTGPGFGRPEGPDIVWPLPASAAEMQAYAQAAENRRPRGPRGVMPPRDQLFRRRSLYPEASGTNHPSRLQ